MVQMCGYGSAVGACTRVTCTHTHTHIPIQLQFRFCTPRICSTYVVAAAQLWDLRKLKRVHEIAVSSKAVSSLAFDQSGSYFAAGSDSLISYVHALCLFAIGVTMK